MLDELPVMQLTEAPWTPGGEPAAIDIVRSDLICPAFPKKENPGEHSLDQFRAWPIRSNLDRSPAEILTSAK